MSRPRRTLGFPEALLSVRSAYLHAPRPGQSGLRSALGPRLSTPSSRLFAPFLRPLFAHTPHRTNMSSDLVGAGAGGDSGAPETEPSPAERPPVAGERLGVPPGTARLVADRAGGNPSYVFLAVVSAVALGLDMVTKTWAATHLDSYPGTVESGRTTSRWCWRATGEGRGGSCRPRARTCVGRSFSSFRWLRSRSS